MALRFSPWLAIAALAGMMASAAHAGNFEYKALVRDLRVTSAASEPPVGGGLPPVQTALATGTLEALSSTDFGALTLGSSASRVFKFRNTGAVAITSVYLEASAYAGLTVQSTTCGSSASPVNIDVGAGCSMTLTYAPTIASSLAGAQVIAHGDFVSNPAMLNLQGSGGAFSAQGVFAASIGGSPVTSSTTNFGTQTTSATYADRDIYVRNVGANGKLAMAFALTGDVDQFKFTAAPSKRTTSDSTGLSCASLQPDLDSSSICTTDDVAGGTYPYIRLTVRYAPTVAGSHAVTLTPSTNNGTALPAPLTLSGTSVFDPLGVWSSSVSTTVAPSAAFKSFGSVASGSSTTKVVYLRNGGTHGALSAGFTLAGDTTHFRFTTSTAKFSASSGVSCGSISADRLSAGECKADDIFGGTYTVIKVTFAYNPQSAGTHTVQLVPASSRGSAMPAALTFTGTAN